MTISSKEDFVKSFLPDTVRDIRFVSIDLDITDLSLADVLRNVNKTFPKNSKMRNFIAAGTYAVGILCRTELLYPMSGLLLIITGNDTHIEVVSKKYIVISISEDRLYNNDDIHTVIDKITKYIIVSFRDSIAKFNEFYAKFVYDEYEDDDDEFDMDDDIYKRYHYLTKQ